MLLNSGPEVFTFNVSFPFRNNTRGQWSTDGCELKGRYKMGDKKFVTCSCNHLSTYAVLMDVSDTEVTFPTLLLL